MTNYDNWTRTNYFRIKDESKWEDFFRRLKEGSDDITDFSTEDPDEYRLHAFGGTGYVGFPLIINGTEPNIQYRDELKEMVADDDAVIIISIGHEKLRCVDAGSAIITSKEILYEEFSKTIEKKAAEALGNPDWTTQMDY